MANKPKREPRRPPAKPGTVTYFPGRPLLVALVVLDLLLATGAAYSQVRHNGFVSYDDNIYVYENPYVRSGLSWEGLRWAFVTDTPDGWRLTSVAANWHPLTWLSHMADVSLFGWDPDASVTRLGLTLSAAGWQHLSALLFHLANTLLLFFLLRRLTGRLWPPALVAALFALHPLHVESVAWIAERKDLLSTLFFLLTLWAYVAWTARRGLWRYLLIILLFALGLMAKPMIVTLPFVLLLLDYWPLDRMASAAPQSALHDSIFAIRYSAVRRFFSLLLEKLPLFLLVIPSCYLTWLAQSRGEALASFAASPWSFRWQNALIAAVRYLGQTFWPVNLSFSYPKSALYPADGSVPWLWTAGAATLLIIITAVVLVAALRWGRRYLAVGWFWFLGTLVPVIGLVQVGSQVMADRYTYIPLIGIFIIFAGIFTELFAWRSARKELQRISNIQHPISNHEVKEQTGKSPPFMIRYSIFDILRFAVVVVILIALSFVTASQVSIWKDNAALYSHTLALNPLDDKAHINLGNDLLGRYEAGGPRELLDQAEQHYRLVLQITPDYPQVLGNLGKVYSDLNRFPEAINMYRRAVRIKPDFPEGHNNLGTAYSMTNDHEAAIREYAEAVRLKPTYGEAHYNLAHDTMLKALALPPDQKAEYRTLVDFALDHYRQAVRFAPKLAQAHYDLGWVYYQIGNIRLALPELLEAARLNPSQHDALFWAALIMAATDDDRLRNGPRALQCINQALASVGSPPPPEYLNVRAIALAACDRFDEAAALARQLLAQALNTRKQALAAQADALAAGNKTLAAQKDAEARNSADFAAIIQNNLRSFETHQPLRLPTLTTQTGKSP